MLYKVCFGNRIASIEMTFKSLCKIKSWGGWLWRRSVSLKCSTKWKTAIKTCINCTIASLKWDTLIPASLTINLSFFFFYETFILNIVPALYSTSRLWLLQSKSLMKKKQWKRCKLFALCCQNLFLCRVGFVWNSRETEIQWNSTKEKVWEEDRKAHGKVNAM